MRQHDVLRVHDAQFVETVSCGQIGHQVHLRRRRIAGNAADGLQADDRRDVTVMLVPVRVAIDPQGEFGIGSIDRLGGIVVECRIGKERLDPFQFGDRRFDVLFQQMRELRFHLTRIFLRAHFMDEDLDPRLVLVVAATVAVVNAQTRLGIGNQLIERNEIADHRRDHRGAAHPATDIERARRLRSSFSTI